MENTPDGNKLPDLVVNREPPETLNAVTNNQTTASLDTANHSAINETTGESDGEFKGVTNTSLVNPSTSVTPENTESIQDNANDINESITPTPVGHDTATTDEEEAVEALLALSNLPDMDDEGNGSDDNANLMPIDGPSSSIDVNPVKVKLSVDDINQVIEQLPMESRLGVAPQTSQVDASQNSTETNPQPTAHTENSPPNSPTKGTLKVRNYGLKKS